MHLSKLCQLLGLSGRKPEKAILYNTVGFRSQFNERKTRNRKLCAHKHRIHRNHDVSSYTGVSHTPSPEHFLLLTFEPAGQQSVFMVASTVLPSLLVCEGDRRGAGETGSGKKGRNQKKSNKYNCLVAALPKFLGRLNPDVHTHYRNEQEL